MRLPILIILMGSLAITAMAQVEKNTVRLSDKVELPMVQIPAGKHLLGAAKTKVQDEQPQVEVMIDAFWMCAIETTHDAFMVFRDPTIDLDKAGQPRMDGISRPSAPYEDPSHGMGKFGFPAVGMTQFSALQFCKWLSDKTGTFYRLPTEAEWEYACNAGTDTRYFFGKKKKALSKYAWFARNSNEAFHEVAQLMPNPWGLYDMYGNVSEWTLDQYQADYYAGLAAGEANPWREPTALHPRTVRGGSYQDDYDELRTAAREESDLDWKKRDPQIPKSFWWNTDSPFVGFRIVSPVDQPSAEEQATFWAQVLGG
ncbi:MAG: formylglycine-generating enzyme family protein [Saprospiraceae bacterium]|nr:formylglycine-generating enzyme family protein [Saprospiraceae bacterium]